MDTNVCLRARCEQEEGGGSGAALMERSATMRWLRALKIGFIDGDLTICGRRGSRVCARREWLVLRGEAGKRVESRHIGERAEFPLALGYLNASCPREDAAGKTRPCAQGTHIGSPDAITPEHRGEHEPSFLSTHRMRCTRAKRTAILKALGCLV